MIFSSFPPSKKHTVQCHQKGPLQPSTSEHHLHNLPREPHESRYKPPRTLTLPHLSNITNTKVVLALLIFSHCCARRPVSCPHRIFPSSQLQCLSCLWPFPGWWRGRLLASLSICPSNRPAVRLTAGSVMPRLYSGWPCWWTHLSTNVSGPLLETRQECAPFLGLRGRHERIAWDLPPV